MQIVNGKRYAVPAGSEFHLGDAADCLGRMVDGGREVQSGLSEFYSGN